MTLSVRGRIQAFIEQRKDHKMGTLKGVFLPNILQMVGVILFMRLGWILGHVGPLNMFLILLLSSGILFVTGLSLSTIVSNMKVGGGGTYYIISRVLGVEFGSAIGILLCLAQLASICLCISGFSLSLQEFFPHFSVSSIEILTLCALISISYISTSLAIKTQGLIFLVILASFASVFLGNPTSLPISDAPNVPLPFWIGFALFFPAITGIEVGMAMSGDLRNPNRSLMLGTLASVLTAFCIYFCFTFLLTIKVPAEILRSHPFILYQISKYGILVLLGLWGSTLSSALGSILGTPRVIQALAKDGVLPSFLAKGYGAANQPRIALLFIFALAVPFILCTDINQIIPIMTMICLVSYGLINSVAFLESFLKNPSWRPDLSLHSAIPLCGALGCFIIMFMVSPLASLIVFALTIALCLWTASRHLSGNWDDIRHSIFSFLIHKGMAQLGDLKPNPKSWRPHILTLFDQEIPDKNLAYFSHALDQGKGFLTFGTCCGGKHLAEEAIRKTLNEYRIPSYIHINPSNETPKHVEQLIGNYGLGPLKPNTIVLPFSEQPSRIEFFGELLFEIHPHGKNIIFLKDEAESAPLYSEVGTGPKQIDLWWKGGNQKNFELCLALAYTMRGSAAWGRAKICIKSIVKSEEIQKKLHHIFDLYQQRLRIKNLKFESVLDGEEAFFPNLLSHSKDADFTYLGLRERLPNETLDEYKHYFADLVQKTASLKNFALVLAGENLDFEKIFN